MRNSSQRIFQNLRRKQGKNNTRIQGHILKNICGSSPEIHKNLEIEFYNSKSERLILHLFFANIYTNTNPVPYPPTYKQIKLSGNPYNQAQAHLTENF